jgi:murein DD-endopeptidase MepM/ murein hydrolase activator NlpD
MTAETPSRGRRSLPGIWIFFQTEIRRPQLLLLTALGIAAVSTAAAALVGLSCFADMKATALRAEAANADLRRQVASLQERLAFATRARGQVEGRLSALASRISSLRGLLAATEATAEQRGLFELFHRVGLLRSGDAQTGADSPPPEVVISDTPPEGESLGEVARRAIGDLRRLIASTGLNVERLFPQLGSNHAEGGPFVPPPKGDQPTEMSPDRLAAIRSLLKSLPVATPLDHYQLESRFGPRYDPFNHKPSFHTGLDLSAPYMSPVYATAAGIVTYAGYYSDYGKVVEIDHGNGIATLYAHLHRFTVVVGQRVAEHEQIGFLGSTGRSSGPHVHYEVRVNDEPQDPEKFIGLARVIPATDR